MSAARIIKANQMSFFFVFCLFFKLRLLFLGLIFLVWIMFFFFLTAHNVDNALQEVKMIP